MDTSCFTCAWFTRTRFIQTGETTPLDYGYDSIGVCRRYPPRQPLEKPVLDFSQCFEPIWEETAIGCGEWKGDVECYPDIMSQVDATSSPR